VSLSDFSDPALGAARVEQRLNHVDGARATVNFATEKASGRRRRSGRSPLGSAG